MEKILFYSDSGSRQEEIRKICQKYNLELRIILREELGCTLLSLYNASKVSCSYRVPVFFTQPEVLVFAGFREDRLDEFLKIFARESTKAIPHKAVMTMYNAEWTVLKLTEELKKEAKAFGQE